MEFRPVFQHENYEISQDGTIRRAMNQNVLKTQISESGYQVVTLWTKGQKKTRRIAKLIWQSFNKCECTESIDHINQNKLDDRLDNLRCISIKDNCSNRTIYKENKYSLTEEVKVEILKKLQLGYTTYQIWKEYGLPTKYLSSVLKRGTWNKYLNDNGGIQ